MNNHSCRSHIRPPFFPSGHNFWILSTYLLVKCPVTSILFQIGLMALSHEYSLFGQSFSSPRQSLRQTLHGVQIQRLAPLVEACRHTGAAVDAVRDSANLAASVAAAAAACRLVQNSRVGDILQGKTQPAVVVVDQLEPVHRPDGVSPP